MQPSERDSAALTSETADTASSSLHGDSGGRAVHPVVTRVLAVTPTDRYGNVTTGYQLGDGESRGDGAPVAARQAAEVLRYMLDNADQVREFYSVWHWMAAMADELDPTPTPTEPAFPRRIVDELDPPKETNP